MFTYLAGAVGTNAALTGYRPSQLAEYLEAFWYVGRITARQLALGPAASLNAAQHANMARPDVLDRPPGVGGLPDPPLPNAPVGWHHLVYAYMLENTRIVDIFRRVIYEWLVGERLPTPTQPTQRWIHVTEQLFFSSPWAYSVRAVTSSLRPDHNAVRRNAYFRLLGMDLNHGTDEGTPYPFHKPEASNRDFATLFEALLVETWRGYVNRLTITAENQTDDNAITNLVRRLREMMQTRRNSGALSREEFDCVAWLEWLWLTISDDTPIVQDLNCRAQSLAERLARIGDRVGIPAHARSDAYFQLAIPMSNVLLAIEANGIGAATDLYAGFFMNDMLQIITHWSVATGRNIKDPTARVPVSNVLRNLTPVAAPVSAPAGAYPAPANTNGNRVGAYMR